MKQNVHPCFQSLVAQLDSFNKIGDGMPQEDAVVTEVDSNTEVPDNQKQAIYYTLKNMYDRWLAMETKETFKLYSVEEENRYITEKLTNGGRYSSDRSEFTNFVYVDSFYNDISKKFYINSEKYFQLLDDQFAGEVSYSALEFIGKMCQDNKLLFRCLPVYSNVYSQDTFAEIFTPHSLYDGTSRIGRRIGNTYMIMYTYEPSHFLDIELDKSNGVNYDNDSFDIADSFGEITPEAVKVMRKKEAHEGERTLSVCAFGVTAAKQNQSYFTKINIGMDNPRVTDFSIMNKFMLAGLSQKGGTTNIVGAGQDMFSIYSNRAYDCSVEMLGCANIMPMMYFQLNNVPMFKGTYMITKVEHSIQNNNMTTKFVGTRMPKRYIPLSKELFNLEAIKESINKLASSEVKEEVTVGDIKIVVTPDEAIEIHDIKPVETPDDGIMAPSDNAAPREEPVVEKPKAVEPEPAPTPEPVKTKNFPKGDTFYIWSAVQQMAQIFKGKGGHYIVPFSQNYNGDACGRCATAVQTFIMAGFNGVMRASTVSEANKVESLRGEKGYKGCDGYEMYKCLESYGFECIANKDNILTYTKQAGDVCVMKKYKDNVSTGVGHVCMYVGKENGDFWVADYKQTPRSYQGKNANWWAYNEGQIKNLKTNEVLIYRFGGKISTERKYYS